MQDLSVETKDMWEIPRDTITLETQLGAGQFGKVYKGRCNETAMQGSVDLRFGLH